MILLSKKAFFLSRISSNTILLPIFSKKKMMKNFNFFDKNHELAPLEKSKFFDFIKAMLLPSNDNFFDPEYYRQTHFPWWIS